MNSRRAATVLALALAVIGSASGCGSGAGRAATVNGRAVARADFQRELAALHATPDPDGAAHLQANWLTAVIYDDLITDELRRRHLTPTAADTGAAAKELPGQFGDEGVVTTLPAWFRDRVLARDARAAALRAAVADHIASEEGLRQFYDSHQADLEEACYAEIVVKTKEDASAIAAQLKSAPGLAPAFAAAARTKSIDAATAAKGGDTGCSPKSTMSEELATETFTAPLHGLSEPIHTDETYRLLLVNSRATPPFDQIKDRVRAEADGWADNLFHEWLVRAANAATVKLDPHFGRYEAGDDGAQKQVLAAAPTTGR